MNRILREIKHIVTAAGIVVVCSILMMYAGYYISNFAEYVSGLF